jgi:hypothetical protein
MQYAKLARNPGSNPGDRIVILRPLLLLLLLLLFLFLFLFLFLVFFLT